jgi:hypothetical protein
MLCVPKFIIYLLLLLCCYVVLNCITIMSLKIAKGMPLFSNRDLEFLANTGTTVNIQAKCNALSHSNNVVNYYISCYLLIR